jgi:hypothetical protein
MQKWFKHLAALNVVGWVEPINGFVGYGCIQSNLLFARIIGKCETQQHLIWALRTRGAACQEVQIPMAIRQPLVNTLTLEVGCCYEKREK